MNKTKFLLAILFFNFSFQMINAQFTKLKDFSNTSSGSMPWADLFSDGNFLYGMTYKGGLNDKGTIFKIKADGSGYAKLLDFDGTTGSFPTGSLISDGIFLYGMTYSGGANGDGTVFKIKKDGSSYITILNFAGATNGSSPMGSLFSDGTYLYSVTGHGGANDVGTIFKILPDGTGYDKLRDFNTWDGEYPYCTLVSDGTFLFGMTTFGGSYSDGVVFKIKSDGTLFSKLLDFNGSTNGSHPYGSLLYNGTILYGMCNDGNVLDGGNIFQIKTDGTGFLNMLDFGIQGEGVNPLGSLISDGFYLYGMTAQGGTNSKGTIFKIMPDGSGFTSLFNFDGVTSGQGPRTSLIYDGACLYGMATYGGVNSDGTIFKYGITSGVEEDNQEINFTIYPNPSSGKFIINSEITKGKIEIYNVFGEKNYSSELFTSISEIDLSSKAKGIYFVRIINGNKIVSKKIMIQ